MTLSERWHIEDIENEIILYLDSGKMVLCQDLVQNKMRGSAS